MENAVLDRFDRTAEGYRRWWAPVLAPASDRLASLVEELDPGLAAGERRDVLDVGCGTGSFLVAAAPRWPEARFVGLDGSAGMLEVARREVRRAIAGPRHRLRFVQADASTTGLHSASVDVLVSAFVVQMVPDRATVLAEMRRVLRPGGILAIAAWVDWRPDDWGAAAEFEAAMAEAGVVRPPSKEVRSGHFATLDQAVGELAAAGFADIRGQADALDHPWTADAYLDYQETTREVPVFESLAPEDRARFRAILERRLGALDEEALRYRPPIGYFTARRD